MIYVKTRSRADLISLIEYVVQAHEATLAGDPYNPGLLEAYRLHVSSSNPAYLWMRYDEENHDMDSVMNRRQIAQGIPLQIILTVAEFKARLAIPPPPFAKPAEPVLSMGFEIEGCIQAEVRDDLIVYLVSLYPECAAYPDALIHGDGSIRPQDQAIEIVTPPLPVEIAMERLEWLCGMLAVLSEEGLFETNQTCGLHVNVSEVSSFTTGPRAIRDRFAFGFLTKLNPQKWRRAFRRTTNRYCQWNHGAPKTMRTLARYSDHYSAINTANLHVSAHERRIEVRAAGGKDYHLNHERLKNYLLDIEEAARHAYELV